MGDNLYFQLTQEFNAAGTIAVLASGQAVVYYRLAIMSKDGDWILRETPEACSRVLEVLGGYGASYRAGAPLDVRWLAAGWSSHFEFRDARNRRIRCDFFTRPPRIPASDLEPLFRRSADLPVVDVESLVRMKQTQRAKDYPVIGELSRLLPPEREIELTTNPDRILDLAAEYGSDSRRPCVQAARSGQGRRTVVLELAVEVDEQQQEDRRRVKRYAAASQNYMREMRRLDDLRLPQAHEALCRLAERVLPTEME